MEDLENRDPMPVGGPTTATANTLTPPITPSPPPLPGVGDRKDPFVGIAKPVIVEIQHSEEIMIPSSDESGGSTASSVESGVVPLQEEEDGGEVPSSQDMPPDDYEDIDVPADHAGGGKGAPPAPVEQLDLQPAAAGQEEVEEEEEEEEEEGAEGDNAAPLSPTMP
jgi:hypothetical protein